MTKIRFNLDIANRRRNQVADVDDETAEYLIERDVARLADAPADDIETADPASKPRRR